MVTGMKLWRMSEDGFPIAEALGTSSTEGVIAVDNPATRGTVGWVERTSLEGASETIRAGSEAFPDWSALPPAERAEHMRAGAARIEEAAAELRAVLVSETGKASFEAALDIGGAVHLLRTFADLVWQASEITDLTGHEGAGRADEVLVHRVPIGPVVVITPWNTPVYLTMNCVAPALAAGCTVVVKPAEAAPLAVTAALRLLASTLPQGVVTIVQGHGSVVGPHLCSDPRVRGVLFVGGAVAGRSVLKNAADTIKKVSLELGGNDAAIVLQDAVLDDESLRELVSGSYSLSGQVCFNIKRIYVHRSRYDEFVKIFTRMVDQLVVGPGDADGVHIGPLTTEAGYENALRLLKDAKASGATVHEGGVVSNEADLENGRFIRPFVVTNIASDHELVLGEQFAPVMPILPFDDDEEAIREANRTEFGLCSSVWSGDYDHARDVALRIEAGNTFINTHRVGASVPLVPFGGFKQSGLGRNHMMHAIAACTEEHAIIRWDNPAEQIAGIAPWNTLMSKGEN